MISPSLNRRLLAYAALPFALLGANPALADVKAGIDAWLHGDFTAAVGAWQGPADKGDANAQFNLAQAYKLGRGVQQDLAHAEVLYAKAAAQGHVQAADDYGLLLYQRGQYGAAIPYLRSAADRGNIGAQFALGLAYFNADGIGKDWVRAYALESLASQPTNKSTSQPLARQALAQMDRYIAFDDRQRAISLAAEMADRIEANRKSLLAAGDLGTAMRSSTPEDAPGSITSGGDAPQRPARVPKSASPIPAMGQNTVPHTAARAETGAWTLQLGAFALASNANTHWAKVKSLPEVAGHMRRDVPVGKVTRLLATGYSEDVARAICRQLTARSISCLPVKD